MYRLIVVDDEVESRNTICSCFPWESLGFEIVGQFDSGEDALEYIYSNPVDVILTDIVMSGMTGTDFARIIYEQFGTNIKIVFLSAFSDFEFAKKAISYEVVEYILKPAKYSELTSVFKKLATRLSETPTSTSQITDSPNIFINTVVKYMHDNISSANLTDAAKLVYMNPSYLSQLFKKTTGANFSDYLLKIRMEKSRQLLQDLELKVYNISSMVGYSDPQNFARAFKKYWGHSPDYYRKRR